MTTATANRTNGAHPAASIDDLLQSAANPEITQRGVDLHQDVIDSRIPLLEEFYKKGLSEADKHTFEALSPMQRIAKLRENNYRIKPEMAGQLVEYLGIEVLKAQSPDWGKQAEKDFNTIYRDDKATPEQKLAARKNLLMIRPMIENLGFNIGRLEEIGRLRGFGAQIWQQFTQLIPQRFQDVHEESITYGITPEQAEKYLAETIAPVTGIKAKDVMTQGVQEARSVIVDYARLKRQNQLEQFKRQYAHYHPAAGQAAPAGAGQGGHP